MKILFIVYNAGSSGAVIDSTRRQAEYLVAHGHEVILASNQQPSDWQGTGFVPVSCPDTLFWRGMHYFVHGLRRRLPGLKSKAIGIPETIAAYRFSPAAAKTLRKRCDWGSFNVIVTCQHFSAHSFLEKTNKRATCVVLVAHGDIFSHPARSFPWMVRRLYEKTAVECYQQADLIVTVGTQLAQRAIQKGAPAEKVVTIPNGIDGRDLAGATARDWERVAPFELLFVGRLAAEKSIDTLIEALAILNDPEIHLRIVGSGPCRVELEQLVKERQLTGSIEFLGRVERSELQGAYQSCDAVVLPSLTEAQPVVTLEAIVVGRPVIATNVGGIPDTITHEWNGLLVEPQNPQQLSEAIQRIKADHELRYRMGANSFSLTEKFTWDYVLQKFHDAIQATFSHSEK